MRELYFDVWAGDDLLGTSLGELTEAAEKKYTGVDNGMGAGSFTISTHSAQVAWVTPGPTTPEPFIRVRRVAGGPFDYDDERYIGSFFVGEGRDTLLSPDEEGGEDATRSGDGAEAILRRAVIDYVAHYSDDIVNHPYDKTALVDGQWHMDESIPGSFSNAGTPGAVLRIFLRNAGAQTPEPMPELTHDFNIDHDTNGDTWPDGDAKWSFDVGADLLTVLGILVNGGLFYRLSPAFVLSAYGTQQGTDLSGSITLQKGVDIATASERTIHASVAKSRLLVIGQPEGGGKTYQWEADTGIEAVLGVRQGSLEYLASPTPAILTKAGQKELAGLKVQHDGPPTMGVLELAGQEAFIDYFPGDTVTVEGEPAAARIFSITLEETETGEADVILEFEGEAWAGVEPTLSATGEAGHDEFWTDAGLEGNAHHVMRMRDFGDDYYFQMSASHGTADEDAYVALVGDTGGQSSVDIFAYSESLGTYAEAIFEGGDVVMIASGLWDAEVDGTDPARSKHYLTGGFGLVFDTTLTDGEPSDGQESQVIYDYIAKVHKGFDGISWYPFGGTGGPPPDPFVPTYAAAECNTPPDDADPLTFDAFYDLDGTVADLSAVALTLPGAGQFEATEDGVWALNLGFDIVAAPGDVGTITIEHPMYGYGPRAFILASGNNTDGTLVLTVAMRAGSYFRVYHNAPTGISLISYASVDIIRLADALP